MDQIDVLNRCLRNIYNNNNSHHTTKEDDVDAADVGMKELYAQEDKFLFQITLDEYHKPPPQKEDATVPPVPPSKNLPPHSPHAILYGVVTGDKKFTNILNILQYNSGGNINIESLSHIITANLDQSIWYFPHELVSTNYQIKTFVELSLSDMSNVLKGIPLPSICARPHVYNVTDPVSFLKTVNSNMNDKEIFDFTPYISKNDILDKTIKPHLVYKLADEIVLIFRRKKK